MTESHRISDRTLDMLIAAHEQRQSISQRVELFAFLELRDRRRAEVEAAAPIELER